MIVESRLSRSRLSRWAVLLAACLVTGLVTFRLTYRPTPLPSVPLWFVQASVPVAITIAYRPSIQHVPTSGIDVTTMEGPATFTFTNLAKANIKIAFPPSRVFGFSEHFFSSAADVPEFARQSRVVEIPAGESIEFEITKGATFFGDDSYFLKGGPGFVGFVFSRPSDATSDDGFCVGTVLPSYSVLPQGTEVTSQTIDQQTKRHLKMLTSFYDHVKTDDQGATTR